MSTTAQRSVHSRRLVSTLAFLLAACPAMAQAYELTNCQWGPWFKQSGKTGIFGSGSSSYTCPANQVFAGRDHKGDENGDTRYRCCAVVAAGTANYFSFAQAEWSAPFKESNSNFTCPEGKVMAGCSHTGDENGTTQYYCGYPFDDTTGVTVVAASPTCTTLGPKKESASSFTCPDNQAMVARSHAGDENGDSWVTCCGLRKK